MLLSRMTLVVLCVMLALWWFTVSLTRVVPSVGVLPMLLLATVIICLVVPRCLISCSPRRGWTSVNMCACMSV